MTRRDTFFGNKKIFSWFQKHLVETNWIILPNQGAIQIVWFFFLGMDLVMLCKPKETSLKKNYFGSSIFFSSKEESSRLKEAIFLSSEQRLVKVMQCFPRSNFPPAALNGETHLNGRLHLLKNLHLVIVMGTTDAGKNVFTLTSIWNR